MKFVSRNAALLSLVLVASGALAEESQFAFVYTTDLLPKGAKEVEQWMTWRHQKVGSLVGGRTFDNDFEKYRLRVKAGFYF